MINWTGPKTLSWNGSVSTDWNTAANWTASSGPSIVPTGVENVIINNRPNQPLITGATGTGVGLANNLTINTSAILTITTSDASLADLTVSGDVTINGTLNMSSTNDGIIVSGNWQKAAGGSVSISNGYVNFNATTSKNINNGTGTFGYVTLSGSSTYSLGAATTISKDLTVSSGTLDVSSSNYQVAVGGSFINNGTIIPRAGKIVLNAPSGTQTFNPGTTNYYNIDINCSSGGIYQLTTNDLSLSNNMNIISGTLSLNGRIFNMGDGVGGDFLSITGTLSANAGSSLKMGSGSSLVVNSGGTFSIVGVRSNIATLTHQTGTYSFTVNSGGNMAAKYYLMEYMNASGIYLNSGANLNATNNFSNGTFANGVAGGQFMRLDCGFGGSTITADSVVFNSGPAYNCYRTTGTDIIIFHDPSGSIGNYSYEFDNTNPVTSASSGLINWTYTNPTVNWTGATSSNWNTGSNWDLGFPPDPTINAIIGPQTNNPIINTTSGPATAKNVLILASGIVTVSNNQSFTMSGSFSNSGTLTVSPGSTSAIAVDGSWSDLSVVNPGSSTITLTATTGTKTITSAAASSFNNLTISGGATFNLASALNVSGNLTISAGTLDVTTANYAINIAGNWNNTGTFTSRAGTVTLTGTTTQSITSGTGATKSFYNLTKNSTSTSAVTLTTDIQVTNDFIVNKGSMNGGGFIINTGGNFTWSNTTGALTNAGVTFSGTVTKTFSYTNGAGVTFTNVTLNKSAGTGVILANSIALTGALTMTSGNIVLGARNLTLGNASTISGGGATSYIQADGSGRIIKNYNAIGGATLNIPMGDINDYDPMTFKLNNGTLAVGANVSFNVTDGNEPNLGTSTNYISRWWDVVPTGITGAINYDISYTYIAADVVGGFEANLVPAKYSLTTSPNWIDATDLAAVYSINTVTHTASWAAVTSFSHFTAVGNGSPLPIELLSFNATLNSDKDVKIAWTTATEINNDYFTVERSQNAVDFEEVVLVPGAGNSTSIKNYSTIDYNPYDGVSYYRLKQTDFNGDYNYSDVVSVNNLSDEDGAGLINVYPNPSENGDFNISFKGVESKEEVLIVVYDVMGRELYAKVVIGDTQNVITAKDINNVLAPGVYFVIASNKQIYARKKFIIN